MFGKITRLAPTLLAVLSIVGIASRLAAQEHIEWLFDLDQAKQVASEQNKPVMIHFSAAWCAPCKELERFVFVNPMTARAISTQVVPVKIDVDTQAQVAEHFEVTSVPTDVLITPAGHVLARQTSPRTSDGYMQLIADAKGRADILTEAVVARTAELNEARHQLASDSDFEMKGKPPERNSLRQSLENNNQFAPLRAAPDQPGPLVAQTTPSPAESKPLVEGSVEAAAFATVTNSFVPPPRRDPVALQPMADGVKIPPAREMASAAGMNAGEHPIGLDGYCGVTLMEEQRWVKGDAKHGCIHRGKLYLFASPDRLERFKMTPDMFSPLLGGADPVEFHNRGALVEGARKHGVFYGDDGEPTVIVLFDSRANRDAFEADPTTFLYTVRQAMAELDAAINRR